MPKSLDSKKNKIGDEVTATVTADVVSGGVIIIPRAAKLVGHVINATARRNGDPDSTILVVFDKVLLKDGRSFTVNARIDALAGPAFTAAQAVCSGACQDPNKPSDNRRPEGVPTQEKSTIYNPVTNPNGNVQASGSTVEGQDTGNTALRAKRNTERAAPVRFGADAGSLDAQSHGVYGLKDIQLYENGKIATSKDSLKLDSEDRVVVLIAEVPK